ncbi:hypothetical protein U9M48_018859 [Paspalum notatum var. saurae]|uniref:Myb/SANT-like domain-containing protein n=1 Tax=Paspalum notatum var. saurae TaxID=547442 RepID=A0AAQ3TEF1_PASNO
MSKSNDNNNRATWSFMYGKGLVDILKDHVNIPMFKGQNGWTPEGWRCITQKLNATFPKAHYTKQQIQEKEKELKGSYKILRDAKNTSGAGWNESLGMLTAQPEIWKQVIEFNPKVSKFKKKTFPLYNDVASLQEGNVAIGDVYFISTQEVSSLAPPLAPAARAPPLPPAAHVQETLSAHKDTLESGSRRKRRQSHIGSVLEDYVEFKKDQTNKAMNAIDEKRRYEEEYSVEKCLEELDAMDGLTDENKAYGMNVFETESDC